MDPHFPNIVRGVLAWFSDPQRGTAEQHSIGAVPLATASLLILIASGMLTLALLGPLKSRQGISLRRLLAITCIIACWFGFLSQQESLAWQSKRVRMLFIRDELKPIANQLRAAWPSGDGDLQSIGPFMAYPHDTPSVLLLLVPPETVGGTNIAAIERSRRGGLRFQLAGYDGGDWLEWHPTGQHPADFLGGLQSFHRMNQFSKLGNGWFLVAYDA